MTMFINFKEDILDGVLRFFTVHEHLSAEDKHGPFIAVVERGVGEVVTSPQIPDELFFTVPQGGSQSSLPLYN